MARIFNSEFVEEKDPSIALMNGVKRLAEAIQTKMDNQDTLHLRHGIPPSGAHFLDYVRAGNIPFKKVLNTVCPGCLFVFKFVDFLLASELALSSSTGSTYRKLVDFMTNVVYCLAWKATADIEAFQSFDLMRFGQALHRMHKHLQAKEEVETFSIVFGSRIYLQFQDLLEDAVRCWNVVLRNFKMNGVAKEMKRAIAAKSKGVAMLPAFETAPTIDYSSPKSGLGAFELEIQPCELEPSPFVQSLGRDQTTLVSLLQCSQSERPRSSSTNAAYSAAGVLNGQHGRFVRPRSASVQGGRTSSLSSSQSVPVDFSYAPLTRAMRASSLRSAQQSLMEGQQVNVTREPIPEDPSPKVSEYLDFMTDVKVEAEPEPMVYDTVKSFKFYSRKAYLRYCSKVLKSLKVRMSATMF